MASPILPTMIVVLIFLFIADLRADLHRAPINEQYSICQPAILSVIVRNFVKNIPNWYRIYRVHYVFMVLKRIYITAGLLFQMTVLIYAHKIISSNDCTKQAIVLLSNNRDFNYIFYYPGLPSITFFHRVYKPRPFNYTFTTVLSYPG